MEELHFRISAMLVSVSHLLSIRDGAWRTLLTFILQVTRACPVCHSFTPELSSDGPAWEALDGEAVPLKMALGFLGPPL